MEKQYKDVDKLDKKTKEVLEVLVNKYKKIKSIENEVKAIKKDNVFFVEKIKSYIEKQEIDGIEGTDFLAYVKDSVSSPSLKSVLELAEKSGLLTRALYGKIYGIYETEKKTKKSLVVKIN